MDTTTREGMRDFIRETGATMHNGDHPDHYSDTIDKLEKVVFDMTVKKLEDRLVSARTGPIYSGCDQADMDRIIRGWQWELDHLKKYPSRSKHDPEVLWDMLNSALGVISNMTDEIDVLREDLHEQDSEIKCSF